MYAKVAKTQTKSKMEALAMGRGRWLKCWNGGVLKYLSTEFLAAFFQFPLPSSLTFTIFSVSCTSSLTPKIDHLNHFISLL